MKYVIALLAGFLLVSQIDANGRSFSSRGFYGRGSGGYYNNYHRGYYPRSASYYYNYAYPAVDYVQYNAYVPYNVNTFAPPCPAPAPQVNYTYAPPVNYSYTPPLARTEPVDPPRVSYNWDEQPNYSLANGVPYGYGTAYPTLNAYLVTVPVRYRTAVRRFFTDFYPRGVRFRDFARYGVGFRGDRAYVHNNVEVRGGRLVRVNVGGARRGFSKSRSVTRERVGPRRGVSKTRTKIRSR